MSNYIKKPTPSFKEIGQKIGVSDLKAQQLYTSAIRKIRAYLIHHKDKRHNLQEALRALENINAIENNFEHDIAFFNGSLNQSKE